MCEKYDLVPEQVYILGRMGDNHKALMLIIERLGDVDRVCHGVILRWDDPSKSGIDGSLTHPFSSLPFQAIEFAKEQNDEDLWEDLLKYAMDKPGKLLSFLILPPFLPLLLFLSHYSLAI